VLSRGLFFSRSESGDQNPSGKLRNLGCGTHQRSAIFDAAGMLTKFRPLALYARFGSDQTSNSRINRCSDVCRVRKGCPCDDRPLLRTINPERFESPRIQCRCVCHDSGGREFADIARATFNL